MSELPTLYQQFIYKSRYAKWLPEENRREDWPETIDRYLGFFKTSLATNQGYTLDQALYEELKSSIVNLEVMPSMRAMMSAGPALKRCNVAGFNCSYLPVDSLRSFDEALYILMCGTGVGFSVERQNISQLPVVNEHFERTNSVIVVEDSKQGWARGLRELISLLYAGQIPSWDLSKLRPAGARLKTFGGRSSGPAPLDELFHFTVNVITKAAGRKLTSIECHDLVCKIGEVVVVGGVRRSALISLSNLSDDRMRHAKSGSWWEANKQRALANNSVAYTETPDIGSFMKEWLSLYDSKSGERGIFNRQATERLLPERREGGKAWGSNPCCVPGSTLILTENGHLPIEDLVDQRTAIWNGNEWSTVVPYSTGFTDTVIVSFSDGTSLQCTPNHKFVLEGGFRVEAQHLILGTNLAKFSMPVIEGSEEFQGDAYSQGFYSGDGNAGYTFSWVYEPKYTVIPRLQGTFKDTNYGRKLWRHGAMLDKAFVPVNGKLSYCLDWFAGLIDADGTIAKNPNSVSIQLCSVDNDFLDRVRLMLNRLGCQPKISANREVGMFPLPDGLSGLKDYQCKQVWRLLLSSMDVKTLKDLGLNLSRVDISLANPQRDARRFVKVLSVQDAEPCETYCFTEPKNGTGTFNGIVTGNSEIVLRPYQFCNLTEVVARADDTLDSLRHKVHVATILGTFQATLTDFKYLRKIWETNTKEEALLGVSITGILDHPVLGTTTEESAQWQQVLKEQAIESNREMAKALGIEQSKAITCVKPSGTVSQLVDSASGIHARHSKYYVRTVRGDKKDPLTQFLIEHGVPCEDDVMNPSSTVVFSFPQKSPEGAVTRDSLDALSHLKLWLHYQVNWCEHKPSVTITVKEHEWIDVGAWVFKNFDYLSGISFLPFSEHSYKQAPYQECTKEEYEALLAKIPQEIDWAKLSEYETEDTTTGSQEMACSGGVCEIVDIGAK